MQHAGQLSPLPSTGDVFLDARGGARTMRVSWHHEAGLVVLSLWREGTCAGSFRLDVSEVPTLIELLRAGLDASYDDARVSFIPGMRGFDALESTDGGGRADAGDHAGDHMGDRVGDDRYGGVAG